MLISSNGSKDDLDELWNREATAESKRRSILYDAHSFFADADFEKYQEGNVL
jgi:hypothetical protein